MTATCVELVVGKNPPDVAALSALTIGTDTVEATRLALVGKIGENMSLRRFARLEATGKLVSYIHMGAKVGVLLDLVGGDEQLGKDLSMHIAASQAESAGFQRRSCRTARCRAPHRHRKGARRQQAGGDA